VFRAWGNEENGTRGYRVMLAADMLHTPPPEIYKKLPVRVAVGTFPVKGLKVPVHPKLPDRPVPAAQMKTLQNDRCKRRSLGLC
jgi:hypothetical protein